MLLCVPIFAEKWEMSEGRVWSRDPNAATLSKDGDTYKIVHTGRDSWALSEGKRISVKSGEIFELTLDAAVIKGTGRAEISVVYCSRHEIALFPFS